MNSVEDYGEKGEWVVRLLKNSSFLDFIHVLIDRESEGRIKNTRKKNKDTFNFEVEKEE